MAKVEKNDIALVRDPNTGGHNFVWDPTGDVTFDDTEQHAVMSCLVEQRARWWADTDGTHGSQIHTVQTLTRGTPSQAEAFAVEALQPLVDARRIVGVVARARVGASGRLFVEVDWSVPGQKPHTTRIAL